MSKKIVEKVKGSKKDVEHKSNKGHAIEKLLEYKVIEGIWKVLIKWEDYTLKSWEPITDIKTYQLELIREYMDQISKKKKKKKTHEKEYEKGTTTSKKVSLQKRSHKTDIIENDKRRQVFQIT